MHEAVELLSKYLKINTTNPPGNEIEGVRFFADIFDAENIDYKIFEADTGRASISARLKGTGKEKPLFLLNHSDVVLAEKEQWSFDPFGGEIRDGFIHGRGAIDMKGQGIMELMAFLEVSRSKQTPSRDIVFLAVADEEASGIKGVQYLFDNHPDELDAGLVLNEGGHGIIDMLPDRPVMLISTAEKASNWLHVSCQGPPGHGSVPHGQNALERLVRGLNRLQKTTPPIILTDVTAEFFKKLAGYWDFLQPYGSDNKNETLVKCLTESGLVSTPQISAMLRNTISTNVIRSGSKTNVIPSTAEAKLDIRLLPGQDSDEFLTEIKAQLADDEIKIEFITKDESFGSPIDTKDYRTIENVLGQHFPGAITAPWLMLGASDSRFFRERGVNAYGVFPAMFSKEDGKMIHGIDEKISEKNLITGSAVYIDIVKALCEL